MKRGRDHHDDDEGGSPAAAAQRRRTTLSRTTTTPIPAPLLHHRRDFDSSLPVLDVERFSGRNDNTSSSLFASDSRVVIGSAIPMRVCAAPPIVGAPAVRPIVPPPSEVEVGKTAAHMNYNHHPNHNHHSSTWTTTADRDMLERLTKYVRVIPNQGITQLPSHLNNGDTTAADLMDDDDNNNNNSDSMLVDSNHNNEETTKVDVNDPEYMKGNWGGFFQQQKIVVWKCDACNSPNYDALGTQCISCGHPRYAAASNGSNSHTEAPLASSSTSSVSLQPIQTDPSMSRGTGTTNGTLSSTGIRFGVGDNHINHSSAQSAAAPSFGFNSFGNSSSSLWSTAAASSTASNNSTSINTTTNTQHHTTSSFQFAAAPGDRTIAPPIVFGVFDPTRTTDRDQNTSTTTTAATNLTVIQEDQLMMIRESAVTATDYTNEVEESATTSSLLSRGPVTTTTMTTNSSGRPRERRHSMGAEVAPASSSMASSNRSSGERGTTAASRLRSSISAVHDRPTTGNIGIEEPVLAMSRSGGVSSPAGFSTPSGISSLVFSTSSSGLLSSAPSTAASASAATLSTTSASSRRSTTRSGMVYGSTGSSVEHSDTPVNFTVQSSFQQSK